MACDIRTDNIDDSTERRLDKALARIVAMEREIEGPDGFDTWKDAAIHERVRRVEIEKREEAFEDYVEKIKPIIKEARLCLDHARVFISTRQKMHKDGRVPHDKIITALDELLQNLS